MSNYKSATVTIPTFVNPHLFWIFESENSKKRHNLEQGLQSAPHALETVLVGKVVLVHDGGEWKRAIITSAECPYNCWLVDYGKPHQAFKVYKLPKEFAEQKLLVKQAALHNVVCVKQEFNGVGIITSEAIKFSAGVTKRAIEHIVGATNIYFRCLKEINGIHVGEVTIVKPDGLYSLTDTMVEEELLLRNEDLFGIAFERNSRSDHHQYLHDLQLPGPCSNSVLRKELDSIQDVVSLKGVGRGIRPAPKEKLNPGGSGNSKIKNTFLEKWVEESKNTVTDDNLSYESDSDSKNDSVIAKKALQEFSKLHSSSDTVKTNSSISDIALQQNESSHSGLEKSAVLKHLIRKSFRNDSSTEPYNDKTTDISDSFSFTKASISKIKSNNTTGSASSCSVEIEYSGRFDRSNDCCTDVGQSANQSGPKQVPDDSCTFSLKINSSPILEGGVLKSDVLKNIFKGRGRRTSNEIAEDFNRSVAMDSSCDSDKPNKLISMLQKSFATSPSTTKDQMDHDSTKGSSNSSNIRPDIDFKMQHASKVLKWDDFQDEKDTKINQNKKHLNIIPSGMTVKNSPNENKGQKQLLPKDNSGKASKPSSEDGEKPKSTASPSVVSASGSNVAKSEAGNAENPNRICVVGCTCVQCREWTSNTLFEKQGDFADEVVAKKRKSHSKPPLLFKSEGDKDDEEIKKHTYITPFTTKTERATAPRILVHGTSFAAPVTSVTDPPFHADIHKALRSFEQVYSIQSFVWPSLMRHMNVCMVGAPQCGKTMAYMPAICSYLLERRERYKDLPENTISPIAIIVCSETQVAEDVFNTMLKLLERSSNRPVPALAIQPMDKKCLNQFQKQCDVLVATPITLVSLLRARLISIKRLCHLVAENLDKILEKFPKEMDSFLKLVQSMLSHRACYYTVQFVVTAEQWTLPLENVMKCLSSVPVVCIGSHLEAALYGRVDLQLHFLESQRKMSTLANLLKDKANVCKTIVICNSDEEINEAKEYLNMNGVDSMSVYNTTEKGEITEIELRWLNSIGGRHSVLLCTDQVYNHSLHISNAVFLVHYSLPSTWSQFINRLGCMLDNYISPLSPKYPDNWTRCIVHIFVDEVCSKQFPKLIELMQRMGAKLSPAFQNFYKSTIEGREQKNIASKIKFCSNLKLFGKCSSIRCRKRHMPSPELDYSNGVPKSGLVKFKLLHVQDVTSFTVKLLQHTDVEGNVNRWETYDSLQEDLQKAMAEQKNCVFDVKPGRWYVLQQTLKEHCYFRCAVQKILKEEKITKRASEVAVRLLDSGVEMRVATVFLYELPKAFRDIPGVGVDVILTNAVPPDLDENWSSNSKSKVKKILTQSGCYTDGTYGTGQILLQLGNVIWVKNILFQEDLAATGVTVTKLNLRKTLQDQHLSDFREEQLQGLYKLCEDVGIKLPDYKLSLKAENLSNKLQVQAQSQWAFFDDTDCNEVYISSVVSPSLFFVRLKKFYSLFENLQKCIQEAIAKPFYPSDFEVLADRCYLAKDPESDEFCRVKILEIRDNMVEVFYVDFGDTSWVNKADLKYLSDELIMKLPFQVIECRLYGIEPIWDEWDDTATDILCEYIFEPKTDYFRTLYTTSCKQEDACWSGGQKCAILLVDNFKQKVVIINQLLIDCGQAISLKDEDLDIQFHVPEKCEEEEESDIDIDCDKDYTLEDVKMLKDKYGNSTTQYEDMSEECNENSDLNRSKSPASTESHHSWAIEINDAEIFMKKLLGINTDEIATTSSYQDLPPMRALPPASHCTPSVVWHQTLTHLKINIILPNLNQYEIQVLRGMVLVFKAMYNDKQYQLELQLFSKVERTFQDSPSGPHVKVTLTKCTPIEWPRLILEKKRMRHIKYDISQCSIPEDKKETFLNLGKHLDDDKEEDNVVTFDFGSDEDYSESDPESRDSSD